MLTPFSARFRWVDLQIQSLRPLKVAADIETRLGRLPETLDASYWEIFEQIQNSGEHAAKLARITFQWLLFAQMPIDISDFALLASVHSRDSQAINTHQVLDVCANLVMSDDKNSFRFTHLSVREFLEGLSETRQIYYFRSDEANANIASACLSYLESTTDSASNKMESHLSVARQLRENPALRMYTANYWPYHVSMSGQFKHTPPLELRVRAFLIKDNDVSPLFIHWCKIVGELDSAALPDIREAAIIPPDPIWLAHAYDITEVNEVSIADEEKQVKAFLHAAGEGNSKVMLTLLRQGINLKEIGDGAMTAAASSKQGEAVALLLENGVPVNETMLTRAVVNEHTSVVVAMIEKGSQYFTAAALSRTLGTAASYGDSKSVTALLNHGAQKEPFAVVRAIRNETPGAAHNLIDFSFDITGQYLIEERTPLHWAAQRGFDTIATKLLSKGVPVNVCDGDNNMPLHLAAWKGRSEIAYMLLEHGAHLSAKNLDGQTPLHLAAMMGHTKTASILLDHVADVSTTDLEDQTPLQLAKLYCREAVKAPTTPPDGSDPSNVKHMLSQGSLGPQLLSSTATPDIRLNESKEPLYTVVESLVIPNFDAPRYHEDTSSPVLHPIMPTSIGESYKISDCQEHSVDRTQSETELGTPIKTADSLVDGDPFSV